MTTTPGETPVERRLREMARRERDDDGMIERPSEVDINRLEKLVWDANLDRVLVWYRDQIEQLRCRVRESERATQLEADRRIFAEQKFAALLARCEGDR